MQVKELKLWLETEEVEVVEEVAGIFNFSPLKNSPDLIFLPQLSTVDSLLQLHKRLAW